MLKYRVIPTTERVYRTLIKDHVDDLKVVSSSASDRMGRCRMLWGFDDDSETPFLEMLYTWDPLRVRWDHQKDRFDRRDETKQYWLHLSTEEGGS